MPPEPVPLACIVHSGAYERVRFALATAAAAAAVDRPVTLFFTMDACRALADPPGWRELESAAGAEAEDRALRERGVAGFEDLLEACRELGVRFVACAMGLQARGIERASLRDDLPVEEGGLGGLLAGDGARAQLLFV